jgi:glutathione synthase/RimK-type ligase-like ATP-grasp enzyme
MAADDAPITIAVRMTQRILIVTHRADLHADLVMDRIAAQGHSPFRLNLDEFPAAFCVDLAFVDGTWQGSLSYRPTGDVLTLADIGAVWVRKPAEFAFESTDLGPQEKAYASEETEHVLLGLLYSLDCRWMSHPSALRGAQWKGEQLLRAARMGFQVPASLIANRPEPVHRFRAAVGGDIVFKTMASPFLGADKVEAEDRVATGLATTRITDDYLDMLDSVREVPCFFQNHVAKAYELRITVIGERVFAAKIHSQDDDRTRTDYRDFSAEIRYESCSLPADVAQRCRDFVHSYGLTYGAIDLIVTPAGDYVFLENNPGGQFLFVEQLVPELRMIDAVADYLIAGTRGER